MASSIRPLSSTIRRQLYLAPRISKANIVAYSYRVAPSYNSIRSASNMGSLATLDVSRPWLALMNKTNVNQTTAHTGLPIQAKTLFDAKAQKKVSFEEIAQKIGRDEVATAALFYGSAKASPEDIKNLSEFLGIDHAVLESQMSGFPDRGRGMEMPPKEPLIYRLYEIVQNYGYAYKAVLNEKFGDGIMSAIAFSTHVEKETDKDGVVWVSRDRFPW